MCSRSRWTISSDSLRGLLLACLLATCGDVVAADPNGVGAIAVVVRSDSSIRLMTRDEVYAMFVLDRRGDFHPIDLPESDPTRGAFYMRLAQKNLTMMRALRSKLVFTGAGRPPQQLDMPSLLGRLAADHKAIAYLPAAGLPSGTRSVAILQPDPSAP